MKTPWIIDDLIATAHVGETIYLITPAELAELPAGTALLSIAGEEVVVGKDRIDDDTRGGLLAYGIPAGK